MHWMLTLYYNTHRHMKIAFIRNLLSKKETISTNRNNLFCINQLIPRRFANLILAPFAAISVTFGTLYLSLK